MTIKEAAKLHRWYLAKQRDWELAHGRITRAQAGMRPIEPHQPSESRAEPPSWISSAGLLDLYHHGYLQIIYPTRRTLTVRGVLTGMALRTFDGENSLLVLNGYPDQSRIGNFSGYVEVVVPKADMPKRQFQGLDLIIAQCGTISPEGPSLLLSGCRLLNAHQKLGRNIEKDLLLQSIRRP